MPHVTYFVGASLDGRLAGPGDDLAFLDLFAGTFPDGPYHMETVIAGFDSLVMGASTFRVIRDRIATGLHPTWPYGDRPAWIATHAPGLPAVPGAPDLRPFAGDVRRLVARIDPALTRTWLVGGGDLAGSSSRPTLSTRSSWASPLPCSGTGRRWPKACSRSALSASRTCSAAARPSRCVTCARGSRPALPAWRTVGAQALWVAWELVSDGVVGRQIRDEDAPGQTEARRDVQRARRHGDVVAPVGPPEQAGPARAAEAAAGAVGGAVPFQAIAALEQLERVGRRCGVGAVVAVPAAALAAMAGDNLAQRGVQAVAHDAAEAAAGRTGLAVPVAHAAAARA